MDRGHKPIVLMIGSGLHKHVLKNQRCPLSNWETLLRATAERAGVKFGSWHTTSLPVLWEQMVLQGVKRGLRGVNGESVTRSLRPNQVEHRLRRWVVKVLRECAAVHRAEFARHPIVAALSNSMRSREVHIIDLNFDDLLLTALKTERKQPTGRALPKRGYPGRVADLHSLFTHWRGPQFNRSCIWKPHGCVRKPESLRLGLRDYGLQSSVYAWAFGEYKKASKRDPDTKRGQRVMDTWMAKMMELECRIIGVGLSAEEWGLHWLFMQRARNLSRRARSAPATTLVESAGTMPIGVQVQVLPNWDECWRAVTADELVVDRKRENPRSARDVRSGQEVWSVEKV